MYNLELGQSLSFSTSPSWWISQTVVMSVSKLPVRETDKTTFNQMMPHTWRRLNINQRPARPHQRVALQPATLLLMRRGVCVCVCVVCLWWAVCLCVVFVNVCVCVCMHGCACVLFVCECFCVYGFLGSVQKKQEKVTSVCFSV